MATRSGRHYIVWDDVGGVPVVRFTVRSIRDEDMILRIFDQLSRLAEQNNAGKLLLDFQGVESLASLMIGKLIALNTKMQALGGRLALCNLTSPVAEVIGIMGLQRMLKVYSSEQDALQSF